MVNQEDMKVLFISLLKKGTKWEKYIQVTEAFKHKSQGQKAPFHDILTTE